MVRTLLAMSIMLCFGCQANAADPTHQVGEVRVDGEILEINSAAPFVATWGNLTKDISFTNTDTVNRGLWVGHLDGTKDRVTINAKNATFTSESGRALQVSGGGHLTLKAKEEVRINSSSVGLFVLGQGSKADIEAKKVTVTSTGLFGIHLQNGTETADAPEGAASLSIKADNIFVTNTKEGGLGFSAFSNGQLDIEGNIVVNADNAIDVRGNSTVNINTEGLHTTVLNGDIVFETPNTPEDAKGSGKIINANVNVNLVGAGSSWTGRAYQVYTVDGKLQENVELAVPPYFGNVEDFNLKISDGASWIMTGDSFINSAEVADGGFITVTKNVSDFNADKIALADGMLEVEGTAKVNINTVEGTGGQIILNDVDASVTIESLSAVSSLQAVASSSLNDKLAGDIETFRKSFDIKSGAEGTSLLMKEGMVTGEVSADMKDDGSIDQGTVVRKTNTLMQSSLELASAAPLALNRIMMNDVRKRLGDIRTSAGTNGAWARYDGGKLSGEGGLDTDFNTIQVGIDTMPSPDSMRFGLAFNYTDGDSDYARGSADMKAYGLAAYGTWLGESGQFVDVVARLGKADTDLVVDHTHKGSIKNLAVSLSGEFGWRFDVTDSIYVEPQIEATYTYVNGDNLSLGTAKYDVDSTDSFLGRVGFAAGLKCPNNRGNVYVRASAVHEFLGDSKITGTNGSVSNTYEIDGKDTWVEYGLGANFNLTQSTYVWADVERTSGGALDEDWRATVGVRYAW